MASSTNLTELSNSIIRQLTELGADVDLWTPFIKEKEELNHLQELNSNIKPFLTVEGLKRLYFDNITIGGTFQFLLIQCDKDERAGLLKHFEQCLDLWNFITNEQQQQQLIDNASNILS